MKLPDHETLLLAKITIRMESVLCQPEGMSNFAKDKKSKVKNGECQEFTFRGSKKINISR
jgi:hypothetical protein